MQMFTLGACYKIGLQFQAVHNRHNQFRDKIYIVECIFKLQTMI